MSETKRCGYWSTKLIDILSHFIKLTTEEQRWTNKISMAYSVFWSLHCILHGNCSKNFSTLEWASRIWENKIKYNNGWENLPCTVPNLAMNSGFSGSRMSAATKLPSSPGYGSMQPFPSLNLFISIKYVSRFLAEHKQLHFNITSNISIFKK